MITTKITTKIFHIQEEAAQYIQTTIKSNMERQQQNCSKKKKFRKKEN